MKKKGVSPVIATILLVGVVIALSAVVFFWFRGFVQETVTKFGKNIQLNCQDISFDAEYSGGVLALSNSGNVPIYSFYVKIEDSEGSYSTKLISTISTWPSYGLPASGAISVNIGNSISSTTKEIILMPVLRGSLPNGDQQTYNCGTGTWSRTITL